MRLVHVTTRRLVRELSTSFSAPYFSASLWQTHAASKALHRFPAVAKRWDLPLTSTLRLCYTSRQFHPVETCPMHRTGVLADASLAEVVASLCPHCAVLLGSSAHIQYVVSPSNPEVLTYPLVYAMLSSLLYAHAHPAALGTPHALGWLSLAASEATALDSDLSRLLEAPLEKARSRRAELYMEVSAPLLAESSSPALMLAPAFHRAGAHLALEPTSIYRYGLVVVPSAPPLRLSAPASVLPSLDPITLEVFLSLLSSGMDEKSAHTAALLVSNP